MNFESILPLLRQGEKISRKSWKAFRYIYFYEDHSEIYDQKDNDYLFSNNDILATDWELYQETMTFEEAVKQFKNCKKIARLAWDRKYMDSGQDDFYLTIGDILASDWIIVEEQIKERSYGM